MTQPTASPTLDTLFKRILARQPDALALVDPPNKQRVTGQPPKRLTYAQADRMISSLAAHFVESGLPSNSVIAVQLPNTIEFALTGQIARLTGRGTKSISVADHGPHVDAVNFPDAAFVELTVAIPSLSKTATIKRKVSAPNKPVITPNDADVVAVFEEIAAGSPIATAKRKTRRACPIRFRSSAT